MKMIFNIRIFSDCFPEFLIVILILLIFLISYVLKNTLLIRMWIVLVCFTEPLLKFFFFVEFVHYQFIISKDLNKISFNFFVFLLFLVSFISVVLFSLFFIFTIFFLFIILIFLLFIFFG